MDGLISMSLTLSAAKQRKLSGCCCSCRAEWDPLTALFRVEVPSSSGWSDPVGALLAASRNDTPKDSKYDPIPSVLAAEGQERGVNDPFGNFIRTLTHADLSSVPGTRIYILFYIYL